ncbi:MAG: hypothetical protein WDN50_06385 [Bradyrhizobium sp.]
MRNGADGLIEADQGNITLKTFETTTKQVNQNGVIVGLRIEGGAVVNDGVLYATTSVSRNGSISSMAATSSVVGKRDGNSLLTPASRRFRRIRPRCQHSNSPKS